MSTINKNCIAIIPARGGSKRIPNKNIINFFGKPLIAWTIEAALKTKLFDRILVSTDDKKIADVAKHYGIEVPFYRSAFVDDQSPVSLATLSALEQVNSFFHENYETVVQLMANCPLRKDDDITKAYHYFISSNAPAQISCFKYGWMNPWWAVELQDNDRPIPLFEEKLKKRSQDLPELFCPTGAIWISKTTELMKAQSFYSNNHTFYPLDWKSAIDIDNYDDLEMAKTIFNMTSNLEIEKYT